MRKSERFLWVFLICCLSIVTRLYTLHTGSRFLPQRRSKTKEIREAHRISHLNRLIAQGRARWTLHEQAELRPSTGLTRGSLGLTPRKPHAHVRVKMIRHATQHDLVEKPRQPRRLSVLEESARTDPPSAPAIHSEKLLRVGDLAQETGKTVRAIRLYEELGLLRPRSRSHGQQRLFGSDAVVRTRWISKLQQLGMSLNDIRSVVLEWETLSAPGAMSRMREMYRKRLDETRAHLERLCVLERELAASLQYIESCDACDPDRLVSACQQCDMRACDETQPDLVAGLSAHIEPMLGQAGMDASSCAGTERSG